MSMVKKMGVELTAVLPPPEAKHQVCTTMTLTLSIDNRILDGVTGVLFVADLTVLLEQPPRIAL
jgi:pyruvate/2-oxoglutarate dehydrogenase complex dihydrolipoamide acyltransferase (E2) component